MPPFAARLPRSSAQKFLEITYSYNSFIIAFSPARYKHMLKNLFPIPRLLKKARLRRHIKRAPELSGAQGSLLRNRGAFIFRFGRSHAGQTAFWGSCPFMLCIFCDRGLNRRRGRGYPSPAVSSTTSYATVFQEVPPSFKGLKYQRKCSTIKTGRPKWRNGRRRRLKISRFCTVPVRVRSSAPRRRGRHIVRGDLFVKVTSHSFCRGSSPNHDHFVGS